MGAQTIQIGGKRLVVLEESDYLRLCSRGGTRTSNRELLPLPPRNRSGRRPAAAYILASIAREVAADRRAAGLTQQELAAKAGTRRQNRCDDHSAKLPRQPVPPNPMKKRGLILILLILAVAGAGFYARREWNVPGSAAEGGIVEIPHGLRARAIVKLLEEKKVVRNGYVVIRKILLVLADVQVTH